MHFLSEIQAGTCRAKAPIVQTDDKKARKKRFCHLKQYGFRAIYLKTSISYRFVTNDKKRRFHRQYAQKTVLKFVHIIQKK